MGAIYIVIFDETLINEHPFSLAILLYYYILLLRIIQIYEYSFIQIIVVTMGAIYIPVLGETYIIKHPLTLLRV